MPPLTPSIPPLRSPRPYLSGGGCAVVEKEAITQMSATQREWGPALGGGDGGRYTEQEGKEGGKRGRGRKGWYQ